MVPCLDKLGWRAKRAVMVATGLMLVADIDGTKMVMDRSLVQTAEKGTNLRIIVPCHDRSVVDIGAVKAGQQSAAPRHQRSVRWPRERLADPEIRTDDGEFTTQAGFVSDYLSVATEQGTANYAGSGTRGCTGPCWAFGRATRRYSWAF